MARGRSEPAVTGEQCGAELLGEDNVGRVIGGEIVTTPPNLGQQQKMRVSRHTQGQEIVYSLIRTLCGDRSFPHQTPKYLGDLEIEEVRSM